MVQNTQKTVRIVSTGRQGRNPLWVSVEEEEEEHSKSAESGNVQQSKNRYVRVGVGKEVNTGDKIRTFSTPRFIRERFSVSE